MNIKDLYKHQFEMGRLMLREMIKDMSPEEMNKPPVPGGNDPLWSIAHITISEARGLYGRIRRQANPLESWEPLFSRGSTPSGNRKDYPSQDEVWARFEEVRGELLTFIESVSEADLDKPTDVDHPLFSTVGKVLGSLALHQSFHAGQIAVARKALGKKPALA